MATGLLTSSWDVENFFETTLSADMTAGTLEAFLTTVPVGDEGTLVIDPDSPTSREIIYYNSKTALKVNIPANGRGYDNTTATSHTSGTRVIMAPVADWFTSLRTLFTTTPGGYTALSAPPNTVTANGNRSYTCVFNSVDYSAILSAGMRLRTTRTVAANTYMGGLLNGSSQYFTKVTPSGTLSTVTDNFTILGYIQPTAYTQGMLCGRLDSGVTNGIFWRMEATGQLTLSIYNGGGANFRTISTYQSVSLTKKTYVAVTYASGTTTVYLDGVSVPVQAASTSGTAPTTAGTGGDWSIGRGGAFNGQYFPGYLSNFAVFNAVLSAATIRSYGTYKLTGAETNCIGAWSLDNVLTDQNAAANNLTAVASAGFTSGLSPFSTPASGTSDGLTDYGIIQSVSFSTNTTVVVQVPEGCTIPTSGGVSAVSYSSVKAPYGFPGDDDKWTLQTVIFALTMPTWTAGVYNYTNAKIAMPVGSWQLGCQIHTGMTNSIASGQDARWALYPSTATTVTNANVEALSLPGHINRASRAYSSTYFEEQAILSAPVRLTAATDYSYYGFLSASGTLTGGVRGVLPSVITAKNAYL